ncbi:MAG: PIN domain-containing protein [Anaerolineales bacterium]|nr:PIN domain-containing protein [Anaerolineales bacterium]
MKFLLDTDTCVFWLRGNVPIRERLAANLELVGISVISLAELRYGANCSTKPQANHQAIDDFISGIPILGVDQETARTFADIKTQLRKEGMLLEDWDLMIAANARTHQLTLITNNVAHFSRIPALQLDNWLGQ